MKIVKAEVKDEKLLNEMFTCLYNYECKYDKNSKSGLEFKSYFTEYKITSPDYLILIAYIADKPVGYIHGFNNLNNTFYDSCYYINTLYVYDEYRNQGIATKLIETFMDEAKSNGAKYISITNYAENIEAKNLYKKFGFELLKEDRRKEL